MEGAQSSEPEEIGLYVEGNLLGAALEVCEKILERDVLIDNRAVLHRRVHQSSIPSKDQSARERRSRLRGEGQNAQRAMQGQLRTVRCLRIQDRFGKKKLDPGWSHLPKEARQAELMGRRVDLHP